MPSALSRPVSLSSPPWRRATRPASGPCCRPGSCPSAPFSFSAAPADAPSLGGQWPPGTPWPGTLAQTRRPAVATRRVANVGNEATRDRLHRALRDAMRTRDSVAASALRSALAALDNAGAVPPAPAPAAASGPHFAGAVVGLGAAEVPRRGLAAGEAERIVRAEIAEREAAAAGYEGAGRGEQARRLRREARILASVLDRDA